MSAKLTRQGARNLTASIDRIASAIQENADILGVDPRIAKDFAYRCDMISDAVESRAVHNFPKQSNFDAEVIGETVSGPLEDGEVTKDSTGHFTQERFTELSDLQEGGDLGPIHLANLQIAVEKLASVLSPKKAEVRKTAKSRDLGFNLTK
jgi:hypothetical protein